MARKYTKVEQLAEIVKRVIIKEKPMAKSQPASGLRRNS